MTANAIETNLANHALIHDLVAWIATKPQPYDNVMSAWRTSCPRLTIWEDACDYKMVEHYRDNGIAMVRATPKGIAFIKQNN